MEASLKDKGWPPKLEKRTGERKWRRKQKNSEANQKIQRKFSFTCKYQICPCPTTSQALLPPCTTGHGDALVSVLAKSACLFSLLVTEEGPVFRPLYPGLRLFLPSSWMESGYSQLLLLGRIPPSLLPSCQLSNVTRWSSPLSTHGRCQWSDPRAVLLLDCLPWVL